MAYDETAKGPKWTHPNRVEETATSTCFRVRQRVGLPGIVGHRRVAQAVAFCAVVLAATRCASDNGGPNPTTVPERAVVELAAETFPLQGAPWGVAVDGETVWVSDAARGALLQVDAASGDVVGELATGAPDPRDTGLALGDGRMWVANLGGTVGVIDIATGQSVARASIGDGEPAAVILDDRWAWVPTHGPGGGLVRLDRNDPQLDPLTLPLPESGFAAAVTDGAVWVAGLERRVFAVDPDTSTVHRSVDVGGAPRGVAVTEGDVWVTLRDERAVARIDAISGDEVARIDIDGRPWPMQPARTRCGSPRSRVACSVSTRRATPSGLRRRSRPKAAASPSATVWSGSPAKAAP